MCSEEQDFTEFQSVLQGYLFLSKLSPSSAAKQELPINFQGSGNDDTPTWKYYLQNLETKIKPKDEILQSQVL